MIPSRRGLIAAVLGFPLAIIPGRGLEPRTSRRCKEENGVMFRTAIIAASVGVVILLPVGALVGPFRAEAWRVVGAGVACLLGGLAAAWVCRLGRQFQGGELAPVLGGAVRTLVTLAILLLGWAIAGWLVSVTTLLYSVVIYILVVTLQSWAACGAPRGGRDL